MAIDPGSGLNLAFRLLRLSAPTLQAEPPSLSPDVGAAAGFSPMLQLPLGTELILGETLTAYLRLINLADAALTNIVVKASCIVLLADHVAWCSACASCADVPSKCAEFSDCGLQCELQTDRQRLMLHDTSSNPLKRLAASEGYDFLLRHDVKEPNDHVLTFSATYIAADGSARTEQQTVLFTALNPLSVRTKTRTVGKQAFVEVCVENQSAKAPLFLEYVRLEPSAGAGPVEQLSPAAAAPASKVSAGLEAAALLQHHIEALTIVQPNGAHNVLYQVPAPQPLASSSRADSKADIGRLEIKWRRSMGEAGRLQTQHIMLSTSQPGVEMRLVGLPEAVHLEQPVAAAVSVRNTLDRRLGPLHLNFAALASGVVPPPFLVQGLQEAAIEELAPQGSTLMPLTLVPLMSGVQTLSGLSLTEGGTKPVASLEADILVQDAVVTH